MIRCEFTPELVQQIRSGMSGLSVGDEVGFNLVTGDRVTVTVADTEAFGAGHIVFIFKDILTTEQMNESDTNEGGYAASKMHRILDGSTIYLLPYWLEDAIQPRVISEKLRDGGVAKYIARLWLPSLTEIGKRLTSDVSNTIFELFVLDEDYLTKTFCGRNYSWWLRSAYMSNTTAFYGVGTGGIVTNYYGASGRRGVCPCFII